MISCYQILAQRKCTNLDDVLFNSSTIPIVMNFVSNKVLRLPMPFSHISNSMRCRCNGQIQLITSVKNCGWNTALRFWLSSKKKKIEITFHWCQPTLFGIPFYLWSASLAALRWIIIDIEIQDNPSTLQATIIYRSDTYDDVVDIKSQSR